MADDARPLFPHGFDVEGGPRERLLTVAEFDRMGDAGFFAEEGRHELWDGRVMMSPSPGTPHMDRADRCAIEGAALHVFRTPRGVEYVEHQTLGADAQVAPLFAPQITLAVADFV